MENAAIQPEKKKQAEAQELTSRQLAEAIGVSESSVKRWVDDGTIRAHRTAGGHRRIPLSAAVEFIRRNRIIPVNPGVLSLASLPAMGEIDTSSADWLADALMRDDLAEVRAIITGRYISGAEVAAIGDRLIRPVLERIGEFWRSRGDGILIEHRAVASCVQVLSEVATWLPPLYPDAPEGLAAAGPSDPYLLQPLPASLVMRERGVSARNLGPQTPTETMLVAAETYKARILAVSVSVEQDARAGPAWLSLGESLERRGVRLILGGRCVDSVPVPLRNLAEVRGSMSELAAYTMGLLHGKPKPRRS